MAEEQDVVAEGVGATVTSRWTPNPQFDKYSMSQLVVNNSTQHHHHKLHQHRSTKPACPRPARKWVTGGPGMQAVFLDRDTTNNNKSSGTGVFLPQITTDTKTKKPNRGACSPVLLPSRVVQALNLNVHDLVTSRKESREFSSRKKIKEEAASSNVFAEKECLLPDIFLPKEWTY